jgi:predicted nucleotidyltransferase
MQREIVKNTIRLGNSSAVILPNTWKYKKVRIQLVEELIVQDLLEILLNRDLLKEVIGVYLVGSYARGEESEDSDVDILIVTDSVNKQIKEGSYEMILVSVGKFEERFGKSLYLSSMVRESKTLINDSFIRESREMKIDIPVKKYVREIKSVIRFNEDNLDWDKEMNSKVLDGVVYSLVLRFRELYLIDCIINKKDYSRYKFLDLVGNENLYDAYLRIKNDKKNRDNSFVEEVIELIGKMKEFVRKFEK